MTPTCPGCGKHPPRTSFQILFDEFKCEECGYEFPIPPGSGGSVPAPIEETKTLQASMGGPVDELEPVSAAKTNFIDLATARVAVLSKNRIVSVSPLLLIPGAQAGFRAVFNFKDRGFDGPITFDEVCFIDRDNRPHGRTPLDGSKVDVHQVTEVVLDLQIRVNLGAQQAPVADFEVYAKEVTTASGRIGKRRRALGSGAPGLPEADRKLLDQDLGSVTYGDDPCYGEGDGFDEHGYPE